MYLPTGNSQTGRDCSESSSSHGNRQVSLLVPCHNLILSGVPLRVRQMVWHVGIQRLLKRRMIGRHTGTKSTSVIEIGGSGREATLITRRRLRIQLFGKFLHFGGLGVHESQLHTLNVSVGVGRIQVATSRIAAVVCHIVGIVVGGARVSLVNADSAFFRSRRRITELTVDRRILVRERDLRRLVGDLMHVVNVIRTVEDEFAKSLEAFFAHVFLEDT
mmetsp:Transcript_8827/g.14671  ORF Transcript_8827/g.14671 Transcript_8827/m.14671 type:complete len:218 (+) Transcript_8827:121-774(+)